MVRVRRAWRLMAALLVAGCVSPADEPVAPSAKTRAPDPAPAELPPEPGAYRFPGRGAPHVIEASGSFAPHETCLGGGCVTAIVTREAPYIHTFDLTRMVPRGVPTLIVANLSFDASFITGLSINVTTREAEIVWLAEDSGADHQNLSLLLATMTDEPVHLEVFAGTPHPSASTDYRLRIAVTPQARQLPARMSVELSFPAGETLAFRSNASGPSRVFAWGPDDTYLGAIEFDGAGSWATPAGAGPYVLYTGNASRAVSVSAEGAGPADASLAVLRSVTVLGTARPVPQGEPATWSFDLSRVPLGVGLYLAPDEAGLTMPGPFQATVTGPEGEVLRLASEYGASCIGCGPRAWIAGVDRAALVAGRYEATFASAFTAGFGVGEAFSDYVR